MKRVLTIAAACGVLVTVGACSTFMSDNDRLTGVVGKASDAVNEVREGTVEYFAMAIRNLADIYCDRSESWQKDTAEALDDPRFGEFTCETETTETE